MLDLIKKSTYDSVLNTAACELVVYFSIEMKDFEVLELDEEVPADYVKVPSQEEILWDSMFYYWRRILKKNEWYFKGSYDFMRYLERHDFVGEYRKVEEAHVLSYMQAWATDNNITLDWDELEVV